MMKRLLATVVVALSVGCGSNGGRARVDYTSVGLSTESDSLSYMVGMSVANQLLKIDSAISFDVVCRAIMEHSAGKAVFTQEEAQQEYLRYLLHVGPERRRGYEEKFLADLAELDRDYTRTKSGLTYHVEVIGNESLTPRGVNDWLTVKYRIARVGGEQIYPKVGEQAESEEMALSDLPEGLKESVKMLGEGGRLRAWIPSKLLFGEGGDEELGIKPIETIYYEIDLVKVEPGKAAERRKESVVEF